MTAFSFEKSNQNIEIKKNKPLSEQQQQQQKKQQTVAIQ